MSYRARQGLLAVVALVMLAGIVLIDERPRVTFAFFAVLSLALIANLERLRRKGERGTSVEGERLRRRRRSLRWIRRRASAGSKDEG